MDWNKELELQKEETEKRLMDICPACFLNLIGQSPFNFNNKEKIKNISKPIISLNNIQETKQYSENKKDWNIVRYYRCQECKNTSYTHFWLKFENNTTLEKIMASDKSEFLGFPAYKTE